MDARIFMEHYNGIDISNLLIKAATIDDDIGTTLRVHLLCERLIEAWICAHCGCPNLFGGEKDRVKIESDSKISLAGNLGLPKQIVKTLKTINSLRNDIAHNSDRQGIPDGRIQSMTATMSEYLTSVGKDINEQGVLINDEDGNPIETVTLTADSSKNRLKLCLIFGLTMSEIIKIVASKHSGGWDNNFTEYDYNVQLNKPT